MKYFSNKLNEIKLINYNKKLMYLSNNLKLLKTYGNNENINYKKVFLPKTTEIKYVLF